MQPGAVHGRGRAFWDRHLSGAGAERLVSIAACWTLGYWLALAVGWGAMLALPLAMVLFGGVQVVLSRAGTGATDDGDLRRRDDQPDTVALLVVLVLTLAWPAVDQWGRPALLVIAAAAIGVRLLVPLLRGSFSRTEVMLLGGILIGGAVGVLVDRSWLGWTLLVVAVTAAVVAAPTKVGIHSVEGATPVARRWPQSLTPLHHRVASSVMLFAFGLLLAVWHIGSRFWNADNTYYLSKATSYAEDGRHFGIDDHLFGVEGLRHVPFGNLLSSFEPAVGVIARASGLSPSTVLFNIVTPASMLLVPFALRWSARQLGQRDPDLIAGIGTASILLMTELTSYGLYANASLAKRMGVTLLVPMLLGSMASLVARPNRRAATIAVLVAIAMVGASPSLGLAVVLCTGAFAAADVIRRPERLGVGGATIGGGSRSRLWIFLPAILAIGYALFAQAFQQSAGEAQFVGGFFRYADGEAAWNGAQLGAAASVPTLGLVFSAMLLTIPLLARPEQRRGLALLSGGLFAVLLAPWTYELIVVDALEIDYFANRLAWVIPIPLLLGVVIAGIDDRRRLRWLTVVGAVVLVAASGQSIAGTQLEFFRPAVLDVTDSPSAWPWQTDDFFDRDAAYRILEETPDGGRFLAPETIESMATALRLDLDASPTYARLHYLQTIAADPTTPESFLANERLVLHAAISGEQRPSADVERSLELLAPDVVCLDPSAIDELVDAVALGYHSAGYVGGLVVPEDSGFGVDGIFGGCELWLRRDP